MLIIRSIAALAGLTLAASVAAAADVNFVETTDAGLLPGTATVVGTTADTILTITGAIADVDDLADVYAIYIADPSQFLAIAPSVADGIDPQLFLFNAAGLGVVADDDSHAGSDFGAQINGFAGLAGLYYLAISDFDISPTALGQLIFPPGSGNRGPTGPGGSDPVDGWDGLSLGANVTGYTISLRGATGTGDAAVVPLPAPVFAGAAGLLALAGIRRLRRG